ncbi:hypothetical protein BGX38DRAFT_935 [Terfezia claveryi]|nr:hypothetical protein BGX38DRAFT_935 [Terfezia claveryi]
MGYKTESEFEAHSKLSFPRLIYEKYRSDTAFETFPAPLMTLEIDIQLPSPSPISHSPPTTSTSLKCTVYIPSKTGPLPEPAAASLVSVINDAFRCLCDIPGGLGMFPAWRTRLPGGISQLYNEVGKGWLLVWTLDGMPVGTAAIRSIGRGWARVPTQEEAHAERLLDVPMNCENYVITEKGKTFLSQLEQEAGIMSLYELSLVTVDPRLKGKGVGSSMLRAVEEFVNAIDLSKGSFWVVEEEKLGRTEKLGGTEKKMLVAFVVNGTGNETWYGKRGYENVAIVHKDCGYWDCRLEKGFDLLTMFKEL